MGLCRPMLGYAGLRVPYTPLENGITLKYWAFHASRVSTKILSRSRENRGDHVSRVNLKKIHGVMFFNSLTYLLPKPSCLA